MEAGRGLRNSLVKPPLKAGTAVAQGLIGVVVQNLWGDCTTPLSNLFHCLTALVVEVSPYILSELLFWRMSFASCPPVMRHYEEPGSISLVPSSYSLEGLVLALSIPPATQSHVFSQLNKLIPPALPYGASVLLLIVLVAHCWSHCTLSTSFLYCRDQNWTQHTRCDLIVKDDLNKNLAVSKEKKKTISNHCQYTFEKKESSKLTVITIGKFQVRAGNGDAHSIPGSFNGQVWKCKQVATHLCLKVKWAWTAKFSSRKHRVTYVYPEHLTSCEWMDSTFYYSFQWTASFLTHCLPGI